MNPQNEIILTGDVDNAKVFKAKFVSSDAMGHKDIRFEVISMTNTISIADVIAKEVIGGKHVVVHEDTALRAEDVKHYNVYVTGALKFGANVVGIDKFAPRRYKVGRIVVRG